MMYEIENNPILVDLFERLNSVKQPEKLGDVEFTQIFNQAQSAFGWDDNDLVEIFRISKPTVEQWKNGETTPHPRIRPGIFKGLRKLAEERLNYR